MLRTIVSLLLLIVVFATPLSAHETGTIRLKAKDVPAGGELVMRGEKLPKNAKVRLRLVGALQTYSLAEISTTATGTFDSRLALPAAASPGSYTVVVVAADDDIIARADLVVSAAVSAHDMAAMESSTDTSAMSADHPTDEMMTLDSRTSGLESAVIGLIVGASLIGGLVLLVGARRSA